MTVTVYELGGRDGHRYCPFCWRTLMSMKHKGFDQFERIPVGYRDKTPIAFTSQGLTPVLVDGDRWINDSWEIADYLEESYADRPLLFGGSNGSRAGVVRQCLDATAPEAGFDRDPALGSVRASKP